MSLYGLCQRLGTSGANEIVIEPQLLDARGLGERIGNCGCTSVANEVVVQFESDNIWIDLQ
jgi:hypothetical protein